MRFLLFFLVLLLPHPGMAAPTSVLFGSDAPRSSDFLPVKTAFQFDWQRLDDGQVRLHWAIAPGYYLYRDRLSFTGTGTPPVLPPGEEHQDAYFGQSTIYRNDLEIILPASTANRLQLGWQGCADAGLCYPPQQKTLELTTSLGLATATQALAEDQSLAAGLEQRTLLYSLVMFFGLGLLLAFTPCSLPMLPILASVVVGSGASTRRSVVLAGGYVASMALVYAVMGSIAAVIGTNLQAWLQQPWILISFALLFVILALPMFGLFELQLPAWLRERLDRAGRSRKASSLGSSVFLGMLSGLLIGPCMTAPLAGALLYIAQTGNVLLGGLVLFALGMGTGLPLLLMVTIGQRWLPRPGAWMNAVKALFGFLLLGTAWFLLRPLLDASLWLGIGGLLVFFLGYVIQQAAKALPGAGSLLRGAGLVGALWGAAMLIGAAGGGEDLLQPLKVYVAGTPRVQVPAGQSFETLSSPVALDHQLADARQRGQWVMLDYSADWCVSCKVMEKEVFADAEVRHALRDIRLIRLDVTADDANSRALLRKYQVLGPPTVLWISPEGSEHRPQRISGEVSRQQFLGQLLDLKENS
ncbi:TPA: protein-disulfide reductase DsbD [Pseudomonas aeruginosa]